MAGVRLPLLPLSLLACHAGDASPDGAGPPPLEQVGGGEPVPVYDEDFFDDSFVHTVAITLENDDRADLQGQPYEYVAADVAIDGWSFPSVGVRLRGKIGSFRELSGKPKWKLDFDQFVPGRTFGPFEALALNNEVVDCSYLREPIGYALFRQLGLPASRTAYARVTVNDEDYGLYVAVEYPDETFLDRNWPDGDGNLYDGKYLYWRDGSYALADFTPELVGNFQLEEGEDVQGADVAAISDAIQAEGTFAERIEPLVDAERFHLALAGEQWIGQLDGYGLNRNNYRVYFDPDDGRAELLPTDFDYAFYPSGTWGVGWEAPVGALAVDCWADTDCLAAHGQAVADVVAAVDTAALVAQVGAWMTLIEDDALDDPRRECAAESVGPDQRYLRSWVESGSATLAAAWGQ